MSILSCRGRGDTFLFNLAKDNTPDSTPFPGFQACLWNKGRIFLLRLSPLLLCGCVKELTMGFREFLWCHSGCSTQRLYLQYTLIGRNLLRRLSCTDWRALQCRQSLRATHARWCVNTSPDTMGEDTSFVFKSQENRSHYQPEPKITTRIYLTAGETARPHIMSVTRCSVCEVLYTCTCTNP